MRTPAAELASKAKKKMNLVDVPELKAGAQGCLVGLFAL